MHYFDLATIPSTPWKNGGGSTRELACWPPEAGMDGFEWRVSVATVGAPGPFSAFAGVDRQIMLLDGDGFHLQSADSSLDHSLDQRWQPLGFAGDVAVQCELLGSPSTDFNLMVRRGAWQGSIQVLEQAHRVGTPWAGLCMVLQGQWGVAGCSSERTLALGQGMWWVGAAQERVLQPLGDNVAEHALAYIALTPQKI